MGSLKACAQKLKGAAVEFKDEMGVTISANPSIPYQVVIGTMDAVRKSATHSNSSMTQRYSRGDAEAVSNVLQHRAAHRNKTGTDDKAQ